jgi:hypothetical protein
MFGQHLLTPNAIEALDIRRGFDCIYELQDTASEVGGKHGNYHQMLDDSRRHHISPLSLEMKTQQQATIARERDLLRRRKEKKQHILEQAR